METPNGIIKFLLVKVDGEVALRLPIASLPDGSRFEEVEAILASNPTLELVDE